MDVRVHRHQKHLKTSVYRKPTHTGRYLGYSSNHPESAKRAVAYALIKRMDYITLEGEQSAEEDRIKEDLGLNDYPESFYEETLRRAKRTKPRRAENIPDQSEDRTTCTIPYVKGVSEAIGRVLAPLEIRTVMKPRRMKWLLMGDGKDKLPADQEPGVVYAIGCKTCPSVYIGETARTARQRVKEHEMHTRHGNTQLSALASHAHAHAHEIHWKARVIARKATQKNAR